MSRYRGLTSIGLLMEAARCRHVPKPSLAKFYDEAGRFSAGPLNGTASAANQSWAALLKLKCDGDTARYVVNAGFDNEATRDASFHARSSILEFEG